MVCGELASGIELEFLTSGVRIQPLEGYLRDEHREFMYAEFDVSEDAGLVIQKNAREAEPVHIKIGGNVMHRMVLPADPVDFQHDIERDTVAKVKLYDALYIFARNVVSKSWDAISLPVVVEHLMDKRRDPHGVIQETRYTDAELKTRMAARVQNHGGPGGRAVEKVETAYGFLALNPQAMAAGFDFDDANGLEALMTVMDAFELDAWVDNDGVLIIGKDPGWGEVMSVLKTGDLEKLARYTVTESGEKTKTVIVDGPFQTKKGKFINELVGTKHKGTYGKAVATREDISSGAVKYAELKRVEELKNLERAAANALISQSMKETDGSIEFDGYVLDGDEQEAAAKLSTGDHILVDGRVPDKCPNKRGDLVGGEFVVQSVQHRMNPREGWRIILEVAEIPDMSSLDVRSWRYDPRTGIRYEDDSIYDGENEPPSESPLAGGLR